MIMKEPRNFKIHRLQFLHAYEFDHNAMLTLHWRHTLHSIEDQKLLNDGAYGNMPNILAVTPVFMEELMLQIMQLTSNKIIMFDNNGTIYYDRIVASIMSLLSQHYGAHKNVIILWSKTLEKDRYQLK